MTQDEIIEMARRAWVDSGEGWVVKDWFDDRAKAFEAFAKLVAAKERDRMVFRATPYDWSKALIEAEREACAALVEREWSTREEKAVCDELAAYIRARGEA